MSANYKVPGCILKQQKVNTIKTFATSNPFDIEMISGQNVTLVRGKLNAVYDTAASVTPSEDGIAKLVKGIKLQVNKGSAYMETISLQQLVLYNQHLVRGRLANDQPSSTISQTGVTGAVEFYFSPSLTPLSPTNPKFAIPGQYPTINSIDVVGSWGSDSDLGIGYTVDPSTSIEIVEQDGWVCGSDVYSERFPLINGEAALPYWQYGSHPITAAVGNLGEQIVLPQGALIRNIFLIVKDSNGVRSNSIVSEMAVKKSDGTNLWGPFNFSSAQKNKADNLYMTSLPGCYLFQLGEDIAGSDVSVEGGIVLKKYADVALQFTTTGTGTIEYIFDMLIKRKVE